MTISKMYGTAVMEIYEADCELLHNAINKLYQAIELLNMTR